MKKRTREVKKEDLMKELIKATSIFHRKLDKIESEVSQLWWQKMKIEALKSLDKLGKWNE